MQNVSEDNICDISYELKNIVIRPNPSEDHSIYVEIEIEPTAVAFERKQINLIEDLYSPTCNLMYTQKGITSLTEKQENTKEVTVKENVKIQNISEDGLLDVEVTPIISNTQITNTKIMYSGELSLNFIFTNENTVNSRVIKIPFEVSEENPSGTDRIDIETDIIIKASNFTIRNSEEIECEINMQIFTKTSKNLSMNIIDNIEAVDAEGANEDYDSLILYIVKPGDTLWKIAKEFNSTIDEIARMNGIENQNLINVGQKLYIPKFQIIRKENRKNAEQQAISV